MKVLRPTLREKKRWILVVFESKVEEPISFVRNILLKELGEIDYFLAVLKIEEKNGKVLLAVRREYADKIRAALVLGRRGVVLRTVVSGTVEALRRKGFL